MQVRRLLPFLSLSLSQLTSFRLNITLFDMIGTWFGAFRASKDIYAETGVRGLLQGHSATLIRIFPYAAIKFMAYERFHSVTFFILSLAL